MEHALEHFKLGEILLDLLLGERETLRTQFFRNEGNVPGLELFNRELGPREVLELHVVPARMRQSPLGEILEEAKRSLGRIGHFRNERKLSEVLEPEQPSLFLP